MLKKKELKKKMVEKRKKMWLKWVRKRKKAFFIICVDILRVALGCFEDENWNGA